MATNTSSKVMTGARALLGVYNPNTGSTTTLGIFNNVSFGLTYEVQPAFILGRYSAAELDYVAQDVVSIHCSGYRVVNHGPHVDGQLPKLQDLLNSDYIELAIVDRQLPPGSAPIAHFRSVRPTGYSTTISARNLEEISMSFQGLLVNDESATNNENVGSADLPPV
jgi:hypothetical protein